MASSSSGLGRRPLKAEIAGSNPVEATKFPKPSISLAFSILELVVHNSFRHVFLSITLYPYNPQNSIKNNMNRSSQYSGYIGYSFIRSNSTNTSSPLNSITCGSGVLNVVPSSSTGVVYTANVYVPPEIISLITLSSFG